MLKNGTERSSLQVDGETTIGGEMQSWLPRLKGGKGRGNNM